MNVAARARQSPRLLDLCDDLLRRMPVGSEARPDVAVLRVLAHPPCQQLREALFFPVDRPVELRRPVIDPTAIEPELRVGVQFAVLVEPFDPFRIAGPPDA